jgi:Uma2 family endonuclease
MTAEEFAELPTPNDERLELVRGVVVMAPPGNADHSEHAIEVAAMLREFVRRHRLGRVTGEGGYRISRDPDTVRAPDAAWIAFDRLPDGAFPAEGYPDAAPNLAVEVMSARDRDIDVADKVAGWLAAGTERVWVVRPRQRSVTVHRPNGDSHRYTTTDTLTSDDAAFPREGFELPVARIFE